ncbi:MAG: hypothetical protein DCC63_14760 [Nitrospira sp.]|nr:MAG: hypothetical protein DCC63_14760 [Nitrospira sp.]
MSCTFEVFRIPYDPLFGIRLCQELLEAVADLGGSDGIATGSEGEALEAQLIRMHARDCESSLPVLARCNTCRHGVDEGADAVIVFNIKRTAFHYMGHFRCALVDRALLAELASRESQYFLWNAEATPDVFWRGEWPGTE